ncbi:hypothetical protein [Streptomyces violens]|uniref:hypothetical protein n=1 Tax=Streptomyces violens TaxID=66377 RepID=UPI000AE766A9|nr:hypothetical protein [Streptomyces violens]
MNDECALTRENTTRAPESRGCLFALSQPPLMLFLTVIGVLLLLGAVHDLFVL